MPTAKCTEFQPDYNLAAAVETGDGRTLAMTLCSAIMRAIVIIRSGYKLSQPTIQLTICVCVYVLDLICLMILEI